MFGNDIKDLDIFSVDFGVVPETLLITIVITAALAIPISYGFIFISLGLEKILNKKKLLK